MPATRLRVHAPASVRLWAAVLAGHALVLALPFPPDARSVCLGGALGAGACSLVVARLARGRLGASRSRIQRSEAGLGLLALVLAGGGLGAEVDDAAWPLPVHPAASRIEVRAVVEDASGAAAASPTLTCVLRSVRAGGREAPTCARILLRWRDPAEAPRWAAPGLMLRASGRFRPPEDARNPGGFAVGRWLPRERIEGTLDVEAPSVVLEPGAAPPWSAVAAGTREGIGRRADADLTAPVAALVRGMLLGDRAGIAAPIEDAFRAGGTIHVLSISGLHVCILAGMVSLAAGAMRVGGATAAALELTVLWGYVLFVGAPVPAIRSAILWTLLRAGRLAARPTRSLNAWGAAGLVVHLADPGAVHDPGFQLSFAAVLGLLAAAGLSPAAPAAAPDGLWPRLGAGVRSLTGLVAASVGAEAATLGFQARLFGAVPVAGIGLNLLIVPLCGLFMAEAVLYVACALLVPALAPAAAAATDATGLGMIAVTEWAARVWPALPVHAVPSSPAMALSLTALLLAGCAREGGRWSRGGRGAVAGTAAVAVALAGAAPLLWPEPAPRARDALRVIALDVGQGDATLLLLPCGEALLVDAGSAIGRSDAGRRSVEPALRAEGVRRVTIAILSHAHTDHTGGLPWLARRRWIETLVENGSPELGRTRSRLLAYQGPRGVIEVGRDSVITRGCARAETESGLVTVRLLGAPRLQGAAPTSNTRENDRSLVAEAAVWGRRVLLPGDVESAAERALAPDLRAVDLLKVPHHGSVTSCDSTFLAVIRPRVAIVSCGEGNRFGHPDPRTLGRLLRAGARVFRTDEEGAVRVTLTSRGVWISTWAHPQPEFLEGPSQ